jgi:GH25 family lysozyme M1 (1,4-beta-N-acetylmuramidase)
MKYGIDISEFQGRIDFDKVIKNMSFAIIRVGYGVSYLPEKQKDEQFDNNYAGLYGKLPIGAYYYQYAKTKENAEKEADNCLKYIGNREFDLPIFYDVEDSSVQGLSTEELTDITLAFCRKIKEAGYKAGVYCNKYFALHELDMNRLSDEQIWIASYGTNNGQPQENAKYQGRQDYWQYTSRGYVEGINGYVDMDIAYTEIGEKVEVPTFQKQFTGDENIRAIQHWLNETYGSGLAEDGYYGKLTKKACVRALQHELNTQFHTSLAEDGIFGPKTKNACINVRQSSKKGFPTKGNITHLIQAMLYFKGYDTNGVDGIFGTGTTKAVRRFQGNQGLSVDGIVGKNTFEKLFG